MWLKCVATGLIRQHVPTWMRFIRDLMEDVQTVSAQLEVLKHARVGKNLSTTSCCGVSVIVLGKSLRHHQGRSGIT